MNIEKNTKDIKGNALSEMVKEAISMLEETSNYSNLTSKSIEVLRKIAKVSKMDCWFSINDEGKAYDLEANKKMSTKKAIAQLIDGMTIYDFNHLNEVEKMTLVQCVAKFI